MEELTHRERETIGIGHSVEKVGSEAKKRTSAELQDCLEGQIDLNKFILNRSGARRGRKLLYSERTCIFVYRRKLYKDEFYKFPKSL